MRRTVGIVALAVAAVVLCIVPVWYVHLPSGARVAGELDWRWVWESPIVGEQDRWLMDPLIDPRPPGMPPERTYEQVVAWPIVGALHGVLMLLVLPLLFVLLWRWRRATEPAPVEPREPAFMPAARGVAGGWSAVRRWYCGIAPAKRRGAWLGIAGLLTAALWLAPPVQRVGTYSLEQLERVRTILGDDDAREALSPVELATMRSALEHRGVTTADRGLIARHRWGHWWSEEAQPRYDPAGRAADQARWGMLLFEQLLIALVFAAAIRRRNR